VSTLLSGDRITLDSHPLGIVPDLGYHKSLNEMKGFTWKDGAQVASAGFCHSRIRCRRTLGGVLAFIQTATSQDNFMCCPRAAVPVGKVVTGSE